MRNSIPGADAMPKAKERTSMAKPKVAIIDDHPIVREGLSEVLEKQGEFTVCGGASDSASAMDLIEREHPDLLIVDISLRGTSGIELIKQVRSRYENMRMLVSSMHDERFYAERCLRAGAQGYVSKEEGTAKIIEALRQIIAGKVYLSEAMSEHFLSQMVQTGADPNRSSIETLSDRELEVFELIGRGLSTRKIAEALNLSMKTIETYRENIKVKLGLPDSTALIRRAVQWWESR